MSDETLISHAQNGEDVVLWRALGHVGEGRYVDVGSWDPDVDSVTRLFYDRGWRGIHVEPVPEFAERSRQRRTADEVVQAVVSDQDLDYAVLHRFGSTGLSTLDDEIAKRHNQAGFDHEDITVAVRGLDDILKATSLIGETIHFIKVDVEGAEDQVLRSVNLTRWRPWVLVVESTEPNSTATTHEHWEPLVLAAGYTFTLFDGLSRFYVSPDHPELIDKLSYPACVLDDFVPVAKHAQNIRVDQLAEEVAHARGDVIRWRNEAVVYWANAVAKGQKSEDAVKQARTEADRMRTQLDRVRENLREARADRKRLRARVARMVSRIQRLEQREHPAAESAPGSLLAKIKKVAGAWNRPR